jgi:hypothetical protein
LVVVTQPSSSRHYGFSARHAADPGALWPGADASDRPPTPRS